MPVTRGVLRKAREALVEQSARDRQKLAQKHFDQSSRPVELPPAEEPSNCIFVDSPAKLVRRIVFFPDRYHFATACGDGNIVVSDPAGRVAACIDHTFEHMGYVKVLAALGKKILVSYGQKSETLCIWSTKSTSELNSCIGSVEISEDTVTTVSALDVGRFVVASLVHVSDGVNEANLRFFTHSNGRVVREEEHRALLSAHRDCISQIAVYKNIFVTGSYDMTAKVWDSESGEMRGFLCGHTGLITKVDVSEDWIVTASLDRSVRVYRNGGNFDLVTVLTGLHEDPFESISIVENKLLMSASCDKTVCFSSLASGGSVLGRVQFGKEVWCARWVPRLFRVVVSLGDYDRNASVITFRPRDFFAMVESLRRRAPGPVAPPAPSLCTPPTEDTECPSGQGSSAGRASCPAEPQEKLPDKSGALDKLDTSSHPGDMQSEKGASVVVSGLNDELAALQELSSEKDRISELEPGPLARLLAACMIGFYEGFVSNFTVLEASLLRVLSRKQVLGSNLVKGFSRAEMHSLIVGGLREEDEYKTVRDGWPLYEKRLNDFLGQFLS